MLRGCERDLVLLAIGGIVRGLAKTFFGVEYKSLCYARPGIQRFIIEESFDISKKPLLTFSSLAVVDEVFSSHEPFHPIYFQPQRKLLMKTKSLVSIQKQRVS